MSTIKEQLDQLVEISRFFGSNPDFVIAGGGNTSFKNDERLWIKASGISLGDIAEEGFVCLSRPALRRIGKKQYSRDPYAREEEVKKDLAEAIISPKDLRPSVETSLHELMVHSFVVHTHPTAVNALMCSMDAATITRKLFGDEALYVEYTDPGYSLFIKVRDQIYQYITFHGKPPVIIFLQNHGVFVCAETIEEIKAIYMTILEKILTGLDILEPSGDVNEVTTDLLNLIKDHLRYKNMVSKAYRGELINHFSSNRSAFNKIERPFTPDIIVYCKSNYLFLDIDMNKSEVIGQIEAFHSEYGYYPRIILRESGEMIICNENEKSVEIARDVYLNMMKISWLSENFGGPHFMNDEQIKFIDNWEVENYRRKVAQQKEDEKGSPPHI